ncbi:MAG: DUF4132 domain-containing protein [Planctomycetota bacterium]
MNLLQAWLSKEVQRDRADHAWVKRTRAVLGIESRLELEPGEAWSDAAIKDITALVPESQGHWGALIEHCRTGKGSAPSDKWLKQALLLLNAVTPTSFLEHLVRWFPLVDLPRTIERLRTNQWEPEYSLLLIDAHEETLKGFCWLAGTIQNANLARVMGRLSISAYKKIPGKGPRAVKLGNAAVYALGQMPGRDALGQLAMLKVKVKFIPAQKGIEKALTAAASREGLPREEIEELAVPSYGLTSVGLLEEPMGDFTARLTISGVGETELVFVKKDGKIVKAVPAAVKQSHAEELKELTGAIKDMTAMLPAQKDRIDSLFLEQKTWALATWRQRYLDHPLIGVLARRLIWSIADRDGVPGRAVTWLDGSLVDATGTKVTFNEDAALVRLWHPLDSPAEHVLSWRRFFEDRAVQQPFKQAHREVYLLTDAERRTNTYSNRFAAHVIRQHQFHALCAARGWRNVLRLMVDASYPPASRRLERWGLRAEFWIEGAGDEYGRDTNDAGSFHNLTTDQVRFYRPEAAQAQAHAGGGGYEVWRAANPDAPRLPTAANDPDSPVPLDEIPPLVLSEILRDVDLFVGVCSVGNNPQWQDGGPDNRYREYWWTYGFGELSGTAQSRRELLGRLIPRLKIAGVCELSDRFLLVKGKIREYKIHLGSGNILMKPNDQYLCIVPSSRDESLGGVHLPFDGDRTLSIILSKAFMLAADDTITDSTITSQIRRA